MSDYSRGLETGMRIGYDAGFSAGLAYINKMLAVVEHEASFCSKETIARIFDETFDRGMFPMKFEKAEDTDSNEDVSSDDVIAAAYDNRVNLDYESWSDEQVES